MSQLKCKYQCVTPTTLHINAEIATSQFHSSTPEGFDAQIANLVEVFLLEIYRCKLCQFTSSLKNKMCLHVSDVHQLEEVHFVPVEIGTDQEESSSYGIDDEIAQENKENEESLEKMPFFSPMYRMLNTMSPDSCDISLEDHSSTTNVVNANEVSSLFEEEASQFQLDEPVPGDSVAPSSRANSPVSKTRKDEKDAQCEHLLSLGLCRISNVRKDSSSAKAIDLKDEIKEPYKDHSSIVKNNPLESRSVEQYQGKSDIHKVQYFCMSCRLELKTKGSYKIHMQCHKADGGFKCFYCSCSMSEWSLMEKHIQSHKHLRKSYQCQVCEKRFMTQRAWKAHMKNHNRESSVFLCTKCPSSFESEHIRNLHLSCHQDDIFKCLQCGIIYHEWNKMYEHLCSHDNILKPYICNICNQRFFREAQLKAHSSKHRSLECPPCDIRLKTKRQAVRRGKLFHHKPNNGDGERKKRKKKSKKQMSVIEPNAPAMLSTNTKREFICELCRRKCSSKLALQRHMGVHAGEKPFHCQCCDYKTRLKASLIQHMRIHTGEKPFKCELCSYASIDASSLRRHNRTHTSERPYKCQSCSYSCIQKKSLDLHIRRHHTGEMFKCSVCEYSSPDKQLLHKHVKKYHTTENSNS
ncbi:oocyte zinc finger protein XlCOF6-like [Spea bombifrons]|uniref:oocyte zinc finger protein XlCOF6-like n=1 Tax=Spea bombifrons TaxID=233779 RepID=UPI00234A1FE6|nr:oocyte zinc finger protein XlCOF6-like [Spea bombifrons]